MQMWAAADSIWAELNSASQLESYKRQQPSPWMSVNWPQKQVLFDEHKG